MGSPGQKGGQIAGNGIIEELTNARPGQIENAGGGFVIDVIKVRIAVFGGHKIEAGRLGQRPHT